MRKIKNKIQSKQIEKQYNLNQNFYLLVKCLVEIPHIIKRTFKINNTSIKDYIISKKKLVYRNELLKNEWYKGLECCMNRWLKLCDRIKFSSETTIISNSSYVEKMFGYHIALQVATIQKDFIKENLKSNDEMVNVCMLLALLYKVDILINLDNYFHEIDRKTGSYIKRLCTTYRELLGSILYDIDNFKGYWNIYS